MYFDMVMLFVCETVLAHPPNSVHLTATHVPKNAGSFRS